MAQGRPLVPITLSDEEKTQLLSHANSRCLPHGLVQRAQIVLAKRSRYHIHYTPTYASWLNQVERWFGIITQQAIRRGSFSNV